MSGNGKCYPCGYLFNSEEHCYGDICTDSLYDILHSQHYWRIVKAVGSTPLQKLCKGQCRHCETNKFIDQLVKGYSKCGDLKQTLVEMCGGEGNYNTVMNNPPEHLTFI